MATIAFPLMKLLGHIQNGNRTYSIDSSHEAVSNLKLIAKIKKNHKISVNGKIHIQPINLYTSVHRWYNREDRQNSFDFMKGVIDRVIDILQARLHKDDEAVFCTSLIRDLINAIEGLKAVQYTYSYDENYNSSIQTLIEAIERKLNTYQRENPSLFPRPEELEIPLTYRTDNTNTPNMTNDITSPLPKQKSDPKEQKES